MTTKSKKIVFQSGDYSIEREEYWGFRCQTTSLSWNVYRKWMFLQSYARLKDAKKGINQRIERDANQGQA